MLERRAARTTSSSPTSGCPSWTGSRSSASGAKRSPGTAGIVMSANAELDTAVHALKMGACDYITKPFNFDVLLITIENALRKKDLERQLDDYRANLEKKVKEQTDDHQLDVRPLHRRDDQGARGEGFLHPRPFPAGDALLPGDRGGTGGDGAGAGGPSPGVGAPRPREDRRPGGGPEQAREAHGRGVRGDRPPPRDRGPHPRTDPLLPPAAPRHPAPPRDGSTERGTPSASRGKTSRSRPASWRSPTPSTR